MKDYTQENLTHETKATVVKIKKRILHPSNETIFLVRLMARAFSPAVSYSVN